MSVNIPSLRFPEAAPTFHTFTLTLSANQTQRWLYGTQNRFRLAGAYKLGKGVREAAVIPAGTLRAVPLRAWLTGPQTESARWVLVQLNDLVDETLQRSPLRGSVVPSTHGRWDMLIEGGEAMRNHDWLRMHFLTQTWRLQVHWRVEALL